MTAFVRNCWYVVASSDEVGVVPLRRELMDDAVVLYRANAGQPVALTDRCVHCGAPLSQGTVSGDRISCPYHGLVYDPFGSCVNVPSQAHVPNGIRVGSFPTYDDGRYVWIWPGNPGAAALSSPPILPSLSQPGWSHFGGSVLVDAGLLLIHEHLLDITHYWVGLPDSSPARVGELPRLGEIEVTETSVTYRRTHPPASLVGWEAAATGLDPTASYLHRDSASFMSPGLQVMTWDIVGDDGVVFEHAILRALTPESGTRTTIAWLAGFSYAGQRPHAVHTVRRAVADTIQQDAAMVEMVQANIKTDPADAAGGHRAAGEVALLADAAALKASQIIRSLISREAGQTG